MGNHLDPDSVRAKSGHVGHMACLVKGALRKDPETLMPTVIRFNKRRYLASGVNLSELFDQIPEPIAYFDADERLSACNLSFRNHFPIVIESEFLKRASKGAVSSQAGASAPSTSYSTWTTQKVRQPTIPRSPATKIHPSPPMTS